MGRARSLSLPLTHGVRRGVRSAVLVVLLGLREAVVVASTSIVALTPSERGPTSNTGSDGASNDYFPLSKALSSVMKLAVDDINAGRGCSFLAEGNVTLSVVEVEGGNGAMEGLCQALETLGENGTFGIVGPILSSQASLLETISTNFFGLPLVTPSASAARAATYFASGASRMNGESFLFGVQPDVFEEMVALARLILDKKTERDLARGWYRTTESVSVIYPDDIFGTIAASAFVRAARSTIGTNVDSNAAGLVPSTIDIISTKPVPWTPGTDYGPALAYLKMKDASIIVLLSEGYDGVFIRAILEQALEVGLVNEGVQWYVNGAAATDDIFSVNETYHDSQLAYDLRGMLGVRACPPVEGPGSDEMLNLTSRWESLDSEVYPGAGPGTLTPDGRLDPLLAFAYDAVFTLASAIGSVQAMANEWGDSLRGFVSESCPFRTEGLWTDGEFIRNAALGTNFVGVTGDITFNGGDEVVTSGAGVSGSGWREIIGTTYCALNLQPHASLGATFVSTMAWRPESYSGVDGATAFKSISRYQKNDTLPSGGDVYPFDKPTLQDTHFKVITQEAAVPFVIVTGRETEYDDYSGITMDLMETLSSRLGFTYDVTVADASVTTDEVVDSVANGTFDMASSSITINVQRMEIVSFSFPYYKTGVSFVYRVDIDTSVSWWKMFQPFEDDLWVAIFVAALLVVILLWVFDGAKNDLFARAEPAASGSRRQLRTGMSMTTYVTGALLMGQMAHEPNTFESYLLSAGWMFTCFILAASFTAELASYLLAEKTKTLAIDIEDLKNGRVPHSQVAVRQGTTLQTFYQEEIMGCYGDEDCYGGASEESPVLCSTINECFDLVSNGTCKATLADSHTSMYRVANDFCGLDILPNNFNIEHYGFVLPKGSPFLLEFEEAILELSEAGTIESISDPYFETSRCAFLSDFEAASASSQNLTLVDMGGVFLVLGMFVAVSFVLWLFRRSPVAKNRWKRHYAAKDPQTRPADLSGNPGVERTHDTSAPLRQVEGDIDTKTNSWPTLFFPIRTFTNQPSPVGGKPAAGNVLQGPKRYANCNTMAPGLLMTGERKSEEQEEKSNLRSRGQAR